MPMESTRTTRSTTPWLRFERAAKPAATWNSPLPTFGFGSAPRQPRRQLRCPDCDMTAEGAEPRTIDLLVASGVQLDTWSLPAELGEIKNGRPINHDDLLEFHDKLHDSGSWNDALSSCSTPNPQTALTPAALPLRSSPRCSFQPSPCSLSSPLTPAANVGRELHQPATRAAQPRPRWRPRTSSKLRCPARRHNATSE